MKIRWFWLTVWAVLLPLGAVHAQETVALAFVGDIMLADTPGRLVQRGRDPFRNFAPLLDRADVRIGNLECVVATGGAVDVGKPWTFRAHPRVLPVLKRHMDVVGLANNHTGDFGPEGFAEMLGRLEQAGIPYFGGGRNALSAHTPLIVERRGLRIALLGYNEFFPRKFEADADSPGVAWSEDVQVQLDIANARSQFHADLVIPFMHWGLEHERRASARQVRLAHWMIDAGADAVVGGHPHVVQNTEIYHGKPIIYSLGNFVFDGFSDVQNNTTWLLSLTLDRQGVRNWRTYVGHIDREGTPHPSPAELGACWQRGDAASAGC